MEYLIPIILVLLLVSVHLSWEVSRMEEETRTLAEEVGLLRMQVDALSPDPGDELAVIRGGQPRAGDETHGSA